MKTQHWWGDLDILDRNRDYVKKGDKKNEEPETGGLTQSTQLMCTFCGKLASLYLDMQLP